MDISSIALQGLNAAETQFQNAAGRLSSLGADTTPGTSADTVDLSEAMVSLLSAKNNFAANINVLKVADDMQSKLLDILA